MTRAIFLFLLAMTAMPVHATGLGALTQSPDVAPHNAPVVAYRPAYSPLGQYSVPGACKVSIDPSWPQVTLHEAGKETLKSAYTRLRLKGKANGIMNIRWDAPPNMCDTLYGGKNAAMTGTLVIRGITGPNGEQPRLYCRSTIRDGNIPHTTVAGTVVAAYGRALTVVENLHIDGYKKAVATSQEGRLVVRNNYLHHQVSDTIGGSNIKTENAAVSYEFCGNEMSHSGRDNGSHIFYIHRGLPESSSITATWVDNFLHSAASSSAIKSIANTNVIRNNRLTKQIATDPTYTPRMTQFLIDVPGCAQNLIEGNLIEGPKLDGASGGNDLIGIRNRKTELEGCDRPRYGSAQWNDPAYWAAVKIDKPLKTVIKGNTFRTRPEGFTGSAYDTRLTAIRDWGTWPNTGPGMSKHRVMREVPKEYTEQHETIVDSNTYIGPFASRYGSDNITHCKPGTTLTNWGICPPYPNPGPMVPANYFVIKE